MCTGARLVKLIACIEERCGGASPRAQFLPMGATRARSELDLEYRALVSRWLAGLWAKHKIKNQVQLGKLLKVDRATASRYLSGDTRAPLQRLMLLERTIGEGVPEAIVEAFYALDEAGSPEAVRDIENEIRTVTEAIRDKPPEEQRAILMELRRAVAKAVAGT